MPYELGILIIIIIGLIKLALFFNKRSQTQNQNNRPIKSKPYNMRPRNTPSSKQPPPKLSKKLKTDADITSDQVTLMSSHSSGRDEFLGTVEVVNGHHNTKTEVDNYRHNSGSLKSWQFLGFGDRYDSNQRASDFDSLAKLFRAESQTIISEFRAQGWTVTLHPTDSNEEIYHLNR